MTTKETGKTKTVTERTQEFFSGLKAETLRPHFGDHAREFTRALLLRAQEAGIYNPESQ